MKTIFSLMIFFAAALAFAAEPEEMAALLLPDSLIQSLSDASDALAKDHLADYQKMLPKLIESVSETKGAVRATLLPLSKYLVAGKDLKNARLPFKLFSNAAANFVAAQPEDKRQAKVFECPHALKTEDGYLPLRWIQKENQKLLNPFWGAMMLHCGKEVK